MDKKKQSEMDKLRANTDIASQCGGDKKGNRNPIIPPGTSCDIYVEPNDPKRPPRAEHVEEHKENISDKAKKAGENMKDKAVEAGETIKEKASEAGNLISEKAKEGANYLKDAYEDATAGVEEREHEDTYVFADSVIEKIAGIAAREIKGILSLRGNILQNMAGSLMNDDTLDPKRGVNVEIGGESVVVDLKMILEYGAPAPEIFKKLREHIGEQLRVMTGLKLVELNVEVVDVMTRKEYQEAAQSRWSSYTPEPYNMQYSNPYQDSYGDKRQLQNNRGGFRGSF